MFNQSKHTIPMPALIPAATILMCEALQFMEDAGAVEVDNEFMSECTKALGSNILQLLKITPERLQSMIDKSGGQGMPAAPAPQSIVSGAQGEEQ